MSLSPRPVSPLARFTNSIKSTDKAKRGPAETLQHIIDEFEMTGADYLTDHAENISKYLKPAKPRKLRFRASAAGSCLLAQSLDVIEKVKPGRFKASVAFARKVETYRALANGTMMHVRYHLLFDALHEKGLVTTLFAEDYRVDEQRQLSGTVDRVIQFEFDGAPVTAVLDFKSMKNVYFDVLLEPTQENTLQQMAYEILGYRANYWIMLYEAKDSHRLKIYCRKYDEIQIGTVYDNLRKMNNWVDLVLAGAINDQLPQLPLITKWCSYCRWSTECKKLNPERDS